jgi:lon-related putative ATP-dependent protease
MTESLLSASDFAALPPEQLRWTCDTSDLTFETTAELEPNERIIGQERALRAISLGLEMKSPGYNIFIAGFVGTGRATTIQRVLQELDRGAEAPNDLCYVHNFENSDAPRALLLPAGRGRTLVTSMEEVVRHLRRDIPHVFESEAYQKRRNRIVEKYKNRERELIKTFEKRVESEGFSLIQVQVGPMANPEVAPLIEDEARSLADVEELVEAGEFAAAELEKLRETHERLTVELQSLVKNVLKIETELMAKSAEHDAHSIRPLVVNCVDTVRETFHDCPKVLAYLDQVEAHILENLGNFLPVPARASEDSEEAIPEPLPGERRTDVEYMAKLVVDNSTTKGAPVVVENSPTMGRLFGAVERYWSRDREAPSDHLHIKGGSLHSANGGYLVLNATDLFSESYSVWNTLKRTLRTGRLEIESGETALMFGPPALKPEPIPIDVKVVMIGDARLYAALYAYDEEFKKIFKIRADFDTEMDNKQENILLYGEFIQQLVGEEGVLPFARSGVAALAEYGARQTGRRTKLSTRFHLVADLIREASYFAVKNGARAVGRSHVDEALAEKDYRNRLTHDRMQELIDEGTIFIDVADRKVGQVNGLAVYDSGEHVFGLPARITASIGMGSAGIINIEREAELSGSTHDKGVQILSGYLRAKFSGDKPLALTASICFEQSYSGVDGDSASSTEIYALLSALADIPLRQDLAVTGSVNQKGDIQPIGGVNEKIEGFFDVCAYRGLTGSQGVLIPAANVLDLMLHERVIEAVRTGKFHIYAIETIDVGIEILTGFKAGRRRGQGRYPLNTVYGRVDARLRDLAKKMRDFGGHM